MLRRVLSHEIVANFVIVSLAMHILFLIEKEADTMCEETCGI